jgi:hypothetical protein
MRMPLRSGGDIDVCVISRDNIYCGRDGRCTAHACFDNGGCQAHESCAGAQSYLRIDGHFYVGLEEVARADVVSGRCECASDAACSFGDDPARNFTPRCDAGRCVCTVIDGNDSCDPQRSGTMRCIDGTCGCAADAMCNDPSLPACQLATGACVCTDKSCGDGLVCLDGKCRCDSDAACVAENGGYQGVCIDHRCGCTDAAACRIEGDQPHQRFQSHPATSLVCE